MKKQLWVIVPAVLVALGASEARAQGPARSYSYVMQEPTGSVGTTGFRTVGGISIPRPAVGTTAIPPYSYRVAASPNVSRYYAGYGTNDFPYYGRPYGHAYDAWTWPYLGQGTGNAHYYYEVVPATFAPGFVFKR